MKEEKFPHTRKPLHWWRQGVAGGKLQSHGGERSHRGAEGKAERFPHRPALTRPRGLSAHLPGWAGLGAEAWASVGSQGEDWGWRREHSLKGASAPRLAGRESGKRSGAAEEARDQCFRVRKERGFRAPPR